MIILVILICIFNIVMWIVFLKNFKKLFTTEDIIQNTKSELDQLLADLNRNTERNINLLDNSYARLRALNADAEKKIRIMNEMERSSLGVSDLKTKVNSSLSSRTAVYPRKAADAYAKNSYSPGKVESDDTVVLTKAGENFAAANEQKTLFDEEPHKSDITVTQDGAAYKEIPVVTPEIYEPEQPIQLNLSKNDLREQILDYYDRGASVEMIAQELGCSTTEVQFALTIEGRI